MKILIRLMAVAAAGMIVPLAGIATATSAVAATPKIVVTVTPNPLVEVGESAVNAVVRLRPQPNMPQAFSNLDGIADREVVDGN